MQQIQFQLQLHSETLRCSLEIESVKTLFHAFVTLCIDCCNSVCFPCQRRSWTSCSTSGPRDTPEILAWSVPADARRPALHWLVIPQRVQYKLAVTVHHYLWHRAPRYLADYCVPVSEVSGRQHLRSARCHQLSVPRVHSSTFETHALSVTVPTV